MPSQRQPPPIPGTRGRGGDQGSETSPEKASGRLLAQWKERVAGRLPTLGRAARAGPGAAPALAAIPRPAPELPLHTGAEADAWGPTPRTFHAAGLLCRTAGAAVDLAIVVPLSLVLCGVAGQATGVHLPPSRHRGLDFWLDLLLASDPALLGGLALTLAVASIYALVLQAAAARTLGMWAMKTRIIDLYGDPPSVRRALVRTAGYLLCLATLSLGFLWIGFDSEKRGLHDWLSGTYVVKA